MRPLGPVLLNFVLLVFLAAVTAEQRAWELGPFTRDAGHNPVLLPLANSTFFCPVAMEEVAWEAKDVFNPSSIMRNGRVHLLYRAEDKVGALAGTSRIGLAESENGHDFLRRRQTPVLFPDHDQWEDIEWPGGIEVRKDTRF